MPLQMGRPRKAGLCGALHAFPLPPTRSHSHRSMPGPPAARAGPRTRIRAVVALRAATHSVGFSLPRKTESSPWTPRLRSAVPLAAPPTAPPLSVPHPCPLQKRPPPSHPTAPSPYIPHEQLLHPCNRSGKCLPRLPAPSPPATVPSPATPRSLGPSAVGSDPGRGARAAGEVRGALRGARGCGRGSHSGPPSAGRPPAWSRLRPPAGSPAAPPAPAARHSRRAPPSRSAPFHLDFCRRGNFGFGDDLRSYWLPAGGVGGHGCSRYSAPRGAAQRLVSSQQVPSASPGVTCAPGGPRSRLFLHRERRAGEGGGEWA